MWKLIGLVIVIIIILAGIDQLISPRSNTSSINISQNVFTLPSYSTTLTFIGKNTDGTKYYVETIETQYETSRENYYIIDAGLTFDVKIFNGKITDIIRRR